MCTVTEAKKLCPALIAQHVATWREGDEKWAYRDDAAANIATDKVSLDPYRLESKKIFAVIKSHLPPDLQRIEKAGIDEVFMDFSAQVHSILLERFPELAGPPPNHDLNELLPMPSVSALDWDVESLADLKGGEAAELYDADWDDVVILIGSEIARGVRSAIREQLKYTCSAGVASNKMLSKLGSAYKKPNQQTVIRSRAVHHFLEDIQLTKIRNLGGKLGEQIVELFKTDSIKDLRTVPVEQLKTKLGDDTGVWVYNTVRGIDSSEVSSRTQIKSMLSAKSFRPYITTFEQGAKWLRIFAADIFSRLVDEGVLENKRRPKTINLHVRHGATTRSRQSSIPQGKPPDEQSLFDSAKNLLSQVILEGQVFPCSNLSLSVTGFEDGITGNMGIDAFLVRGRGTEVRNPTPPQDRAATDKNAGEPAEKRRRVHEGGIRRFFARDQAALATDWGSGSNDTSDSGSGGEVLRGGRPETDLSSDQCDGEDKPTVSTESLSGQTGGHYQQIPITEYVCSSCSARLEDSEALQSHQDWHFAQQLQEQERVRPTFVNRPSAPASTSHRTGQRGAAATSRRTGRTGKAGTGQQSKLKFG